jgi:hypothetical protein
MQNETPANTAGVAQVIEEFPCEKTIKTEKHVGKQR